MSFETGIGEEHQTLFGLEPGPNGIHRILGHYNVSFPVWPYEVIAEVSEEVYGSEQFESRSINERFLDVRMPLVNGNKNSPPAEELGGLLAQTLRWPTSRGLKALIDETEFVRDWLQGSMDDLEYAADDGHHHPLDMTGVLFNNATNTESAPVVPTGIDRLQHMCPGCQCISQGVKSSRCGVDGEWTKKFVCEWITECLYEPSCTGP